MKFALEIGNDKLFDLEVRNNCSNVFFLQFSSQGSVAKVSHGLRHDFPFQEKQCFMSELHFQFHAEDSGAM